MLMWNNYMSNDRSFQQNENSRQENLFQYFHSDDNNGFLDDVTITFAEESDQFHHRKEKTLRWDL